MIFKGFIFVLLCGGALFSLCSCANSSKQESDYQTISHDPRRDTDTARRLNSEAVGAMNRGDWSEAEKLLKEGLEADVTFGAAHNNLGRVYFQRGDLYLAAWEFQYASKLMPYQPEPRNNLGLVFESAGKLDEAVQWYDDALKLEPDDPKFVGNDVRARIRRGDRDAKTKELLQKLVMADTRPTWNEWAKEKLAIMGNLPTTQPDQEMP